MPAFRFAPRLLLLVPLFALAAAAGCGGIEDGQLPPVESDLTPDQEQEIMMDSNAAAKYAE